MVVINGRYHCNDHKIDHQTDFVHNKSLITPTNIMNSIPQDIFRGENEFNCENPSFKKVELHHLLN